MKATEQKVVQHEKDDSESKQPDSVIAVLKVFAILQALAEQSEIGLSELSLRLAMPKATVYRFLQTMKNLGYVRQATNSEQYGLTMRVFELGAQTLRHPNLVNVAKKPMQRISEATGETVQLGMLIESEIIYVHKIDSRHMLGTYSRIGRRAPLHCTAIGKVLMAWESPSKRTPVLAGCDFQRFRDKTITNLAAYEEELERTLVQGFGQDREELDEHIRCVAIPIFDSSNQVIAGLSVSFPTFRYDVSREPELVLMLKEASRAISVELGCTRFPLILTP